MPPVFGFSAGDFIAALNLVSTVIDALREVGGASTEFREVVRELLTLETALIRVKRLDLDDSHNDARAALQTAASRCQDTIDEFWAMAHKYQPHLGRSGSGSRLKDGWMKVRWSLFKKDNLEKFKAAIRGHAASIELLLETIHMNHASQYHERQERNQRSMLGRLQDMSNQYMTGLAMITRSLASSKSQGKKLLKISAEIVRTNTRIFQLVYDTYTIVKRLSYQAERQQPVYMIDALGRFTPFFLEFIRSSEAFISVLMANFKPIRSGRSKIERGEYIIQDTGSKRLIDLAGEWDTCFAPGQRVEMSMVFRHHKANKPSCPGCGTVHASPKTEGENIDCLSCGINFCRVPYDDQREKVASPDLSGGIDPKLLSKQQATTSRGGELGDEDRSDDDPTLFRRVRILELAKIGLSESRRSISESHAFMSTSNRGPTDRYKLTRPDLSPGQQEVLATRPMDSSQREQDTIQFRASESGATRNPPYHYPHGQRPTINDRNPMMNHQMYAQMLRSQQSSQQRRGFADNQQDNKQYSQRHNQQYDQQQRDHSYNQQYRRFADIQRQRGSAATWDLDRLGGYQAYLTFEDTL